MRATVAGHAPTSMSVCRTQTTAQTTVSAPTLLGVSPAAAETGLRSPQEEAAALTSTSVPGARTTASSSAPTMWAGFLAAAWMGSPSTTTREHAQILMSVSATMEGVLKSARTMKAPSPAAVLQASSSAVGGFATTLTSVLVRRTIASRHAPTLMAPSRAHVEKASLSIITDDLVMTSTSVRPRGEGVIKSALTVQDLSRVPAILAISCNLMDDHALTLTSVQLALTTVLKCVPTLLAPSPVAVRTTSISTRMAGHALL